MTEAAPPRRSANGGRIGCYPGSFNPPTIAHLAVAEAAVRTGELVRLDLLVSRHAFGKDDVTIPSLADRLEVLRSVASTRSWLGVVVSDHRLIADLAEGYDAVVMGADKWRQVNDPAWYDNDHIARDTALGRLPLVLVAPRADDHLPDARELAKVEILPVDETHGHVNASAIRSGKPEARAWLLPEAAAFDARTHAWSDPARYRPGRV